MVLREVTLTQRNLRGLAGTLILFVLCAINAFPQVAGRLSGSVVDQSGASIPGAVVSVFSPGGKEPLLTGKTNDAGLFSFLTVSPGTYDVSIEAAGFGKVMLRQVKVTPVQETAVPQVKLEVKSTTAVVEVTSNAQVVQLTSGEVSNTVTSTQVMNLPVLGRQVSNLIATQAGVSSSNSVTTVNGLRGSYTNVTLDGINIQDNFIRTNGLDYAPMRTTLDQVSEITIATSNPDISLGGGASQVVLSTKSGTNDLHGSVYWYNRNSALAGNDWFNNKSGVTRTMLNLNQPGVALGGRIIKDKLFFYSNYEWYRNKQQSSTLRTVLTDSAKNGIFTYKDSSNAVRQVALSSLRTFTSDATIKAMIAQLPVGNTSDAGDGNLNTYGYRFNARSNEFRDQFVQKINYYITPKHSLVGTYNYIDNPTDRPTLGAFYTTIPPVSNAITNHVVSLAWTWLISPTFTNEVRAGFARTRGNFVVSNKYPSSIVSGLLFSNPVNTYMSQGRDTNNYPVQSNANWIKGRHEVRFGFQATMFYSVPFNDAGIVPTYTLGSNTANGIGFTTSEIPGVKSSDVGTATSLLANLGGFISSDTQTYNVTSRTSGYVDGASYIRDFNWKTYAGYVQDKFKVRNNLTLTYGVRYEFWTALDEKNALFLAPVITNNDVRSAVLGANTTFNFIGKASGTPFYNSDKNNFAPTFGFAWDPFGDGKTSIRGGYSLSYVNDNVVTTVRNNVSTNPGLNSAVTYSNLSARLSSAPTVTKPTYKVPRTMSDNYDLSTTNAVGATDPNLVTPMVHQWNISIEREVAGIHVTGRYVGNRAAKILRGTDYNQINYNASGFLADFKRAQSNASLAEKSGGAYNGTYNSAISGSQQLTVFPLLYNNGYLTNSSVQTYLRQGQIAELANFYSYNGINGSVNFYTNPYAIAGNVIGNNAMSVYHGLQLEAVKRTHSGSQFQFNYTWGKALSDAAGDGQTNFEPLLDNNNPGLEYAPSPYDIRHALKANYVYNLPFGTNQRWRGNRFTNTLFGDWQVTGIWNYVSGGPYSILSGYGTLNRAARSTTTNTASVQGTNWSTLKDLTNKTFMTGTGPYFISPSIINASDGRGTNQAGSSTFSGQTFYQPEAGTVGNLQRRMFHGPWQWSWDASLRKTFNFERGLFGGKGPGKGQSVEVHADVFNYMNHPTFYVAPSQGDYGSQTYNTVGGTSFGKITSMNFNPRVVQIGAYYRF
jgi:hypothetical protein